LAAARSSPFSGSWLTVDSRPTDQASTTATRGRASSDDLVVQPVLDRHLAGRRGAGIERAREEVAVKHGHVYRLLQVEPEVDVVQEEDQWSLVLWIPIRHAERHEGFAFAQHE